MNYNYQPGGFYQPYQQSSGIPQQQYYGPQAPVLNGKLVDSIEVAKASEVPFGSFGIFPKADFSEIYIKFWNNDGTTKVVAFKPSEAGKAPSDDTQQILEQIAALNSKLDEILK